MTQASDKHPIQRAGKTAASAIVNAGGADALARIITKKCDDGPARVDNAAA